MVDHHFSRIDLATLVGGLDRAGLPLIEVGHGNGVGSQFFKDPKLRVSSMPLVDDKSHAQIALRVARHARVGVVVTAGKRFTPIEYIDQVADLGFAFVRLAVMPDEIDDDLFAYVRRIKDRGMIASINMMQTYAKSPSHVAELAARAAGHGVDWFYVVDSAGGMMVDEVKQYVSAILAAAPVEVGLHAHNNLGCATANCLAAVEAGATLVDGTLNGMGRATGNPATEQLAAALRDRLAHQVDLDALVVLGNAIRSLFQDAGNDSFDAISGAALVHSRNVPKVLEAARKRERSPGSFLIAVGVEARRRGMIMAMTYGDELYDTAAAASVPAHRMEPGDEMIEVASEEILGRWNGGPKQAIEELSLRSRQRHLESVVHVSRAAASLCARPVPWQSSVIGVTIPWSDRAASWAVEPDRLPDFVLVDEGDPEPLIKANLATWRLSFSDLYARAVQDLCLSLRNAAFSLWCPDGAARDAERMLGGLPRSTGSRPSGPIAILLGDDDRLDALLGAGDVGVLVGAPHPARVDAARQRGARVVQPKWETAVSQAAESLIALHRELSGAESADGLASGVQACGPGQAKWDPERGMLLEADDPVSAAQRAGTSYVRSIIRGTRRL
ncbi:MAG: 4-hydroxy-2-oxovalerate aldolase [Myxococcales bacterium]|nr:4-hydroxy-2-oxovalerate aldolase [Myxococcales bacterium]